MSIVTQPSLLTHPILSAAAASSGTQGGRRQMSLAEFFSVSERTNHGLGKSVSCALDL